MEGCIFVVYRIVWRLVWGYSHVGWVIAGAVWGLLLCDFDVVMLASVKVVVGRGLCG